MSTFGKMLLSTCVKDNSGNLSITWYSLKSLIAMADGSVDHWGALDYCEEIGVKVLHAF